MTVVTQTDLENAQRDVSDLGQIVNGAANLNGDGTVPTRTGGDVKTLQRLFSDISDQAATEIAATGAAIAAGVTDDSEEIKRRYRWERIFAAFASGKITRGIFDFADYGINDWPNPYGVMLYWTGSVVYPLKKIDGTFDWRMIEGDVFHVEPNGDFYHSVSYAKMRDPAYDPALAATLVTYHTNWVTGHDDTTAGRGATEGNPFKSLNFAIDQGKASGHPFHIYFHGDTLGANGLYSSATMTLNDGQQGSITFMPVNYTRTWHIMQREDMTAAMWAWTNPAPGVYRSSSVTFPINDAMKKAFAMADALAIDEWGTPTPMRYLGGVWANEAAAIAAVKAIPGSFAWYGTTGAALAVFVHLYGGTAPDPATWWLVELSSNTTWLMGEGSRMVIKNLGCFKYDYGANTSCFRARAKDVDLGVEVAHDNEFWYYNCAAVGSSGPGYQFFDIARGGVDQFVARQCLQDASNLHSFYNAVGMANSGNYMHIVENFFWAHNIGWTVFGQPPPTLSHSNQVITVHDQIRVSRFNIQGDNTDGSPFADVLGAQTWNVNVHVGDPRQADNGPPGGDSPKVAIWCDGLLATAAAVAANKPVTKIRLVHCSGKVPPANKVFSLTNGGQIDYALQIGKTTSQTYGRSNYDTDNVLTDVTPA